MPHLSQNPAFQNTFLCTPLGLARPFDGFLGEDGEEIYNEGEGEELFNEGEEEWNGEDRNVVELFRQMGGGGWE